MDDIKPPAQIYPPGQSELPKQRGPVFEQKPGRPSCLQRQGMTMNMNAVDDFVPGLISGPGGADYGYLCPGIMDRAGLLPDAGMERAGQVFRQEQNPPPRQCTAMWFGY